MITVTLAEIADIVGGRLHRAEGSEVVTGSVEFDSRQLTEGGLFVALPGEHVDGHDFAVEAVAAGAVGVLAARPVDAPAVIVPSRAADQDGQDPDVPVEDEVEGSAATVLAALGELARHVVRGLIRDELAVVGVTGSSGKTSTKDMIAHVVEPLGSTVAAPGSFNNELGHPWTVLRADAATHHLVLELSARGIGHIAELATVAPPRIGVVLNVGRAHVGEFGSSEDIARAKGELVEALPSDGVAVLNMDDPLVAAMATRTQASVLGFGVGSTAAVRAENVRLDEYARPTFRLVAPDGAADVALRLVGEHHVSNALAAAAVAHTLGAAVSDVARSLSHAERRSQRRMELHTRTDGVTVLNDSYNANPESVRAALKTLAAMSADRRSWAVLGVMSELGSDSVSAHDEIGRLAVRLNINRLVVVGEDAAALHQGARHEGSWGEETVLVPDVGAASALLRESVQPDDVVLVKASKIAELWRVADELLREDAA